MRFFEIFAYSIMSRKVIYNLNFYGFGRKFVETQFYAYSLYTAKYSLRILLIRLYSPGTLNNFWHIWRRLRLNKNISESP